MVHCLRCKDGEIKISSITEATIGEPAYYCENCGATYTMLDDSGC